MDTNAQITDPFFPECPVRNVLARIGTRWTLLVLLSLDASQAPMRFSQLHAAIPDISQKMLTRTLRDLEADGLVERTVYAEVPPRVEYGLTPLGKSLTPLLNELVGWALNNLSGIINSRTRYHAAGDRKSQ